MESAKYFTSIDLFSGYWQCCIADEDFLKIAFITRYGLYKWVVMPMGLMNAPARFMQTMSNLFSNLLDSGMAVFLDGVLVYLRTVKEYFTIFEKILMHLCQYILYHKLKKYSFLHNSIMFFGFDVTL